ncbi:hypothetical protein M1L60_24005 [Actinoplanes sp. TRM 88003]|uniref:Pyrimidine reductase n=1 Tax=Paractinoplanes aksuensis TaxID=2939490 RepID=A0ABT1DS53_9ACTN|nr:hypothetical protein [Actinoplanes aksuensis]MCO8273664.1 hypothetical protein [Actinoplanes aksuensis]
MRKVIATMYVSLDGVQENPEKWSLPYFDDAAAKYRTALLAGSDLLLQGRATYDGFAPFWNEPSEDAYNNRMYEIEKILVSRSGAPGEWHNTVSVTADPVATVREQARRMAAVCGPAADQACPSRSGRPWGRSYQIAVGHAAGSVGGLAGHEDFDLAAQEPGRQI